MGNWIENAVASTCLKCLGHSNLITCPTSFFLEKQFCQTPKKIEKKLTLVSYGRKWFKKILSDSKKKSASFKNIHCKGDSINYRN